jgi:hypothetical protein
MGVTSIKFSLKSGYPRNWQEVTIEGNHATGAIAWGKVVNYDANGVITVANDYGYFLGAEITADGPSELEAITGDFQMHEIKINKPAPLFLPIEAATVYTVHVAAGDGEPALAKEQICVLINGVYTTDADAADPKCKIKALPADTGITGLYVVEIMNV